MSGYGLPTSAEIGGRAYPIRSDYRAILDVIGVMGEDDVEDDEKAIVILDIFYEGFREMPASDFREAVDYLQWFVNGGESPSASGNPKLMDWDQDFPLIVAPVNRVIGKEVRSVEYLHWWTFLAAYREIGDCLFAQVVSIRKQLSRGKKLDKADEQFYRENRSLVDFRKAGETEAGLESLGLWIRGGAANV